MKYRNAKHMNRATLAIFLVGIITCLTGCNKDRSELLIGTWERYAIGYSYSGSPNESYNYSNYMLMSECCGCSIMKFVFFEDNTAMKIEIGEYGADTALFTYSVNGKNGVLTPVNPAKEGGHATYTIHNIKKNEVDIHSMFVCKNYSDHFGDTTPYTYVKDEHHYFHKK